MPPSRASTVYLPRNRKRSCRSDLPGAARRPCACGARAHLNADHRGEAKLTSTKDDPSQRPGPRHVAVIMDGNGRWAKGRGKPRLFGHHAGVKRVKEIVRACPDHDVKYLTVFAFSTENWKRTQ